MPSKHEGLSIARKRIAEEAERRTGFLDIGKLGLTELSSELFELQHLRRLNLGWRIPLENGQWFQNDSGGPSNRLEGQAPRSTSGRPSTVALTCRKPGG